MKKLDKDSLTKYIRQLLQLEKDIVIISDGSITHLEVEGKDFYLYIKSLTYAGNPYPPNTTRAQLPQRAEFDLIKNSDSVFLFLGYDEENEVFSCWDPIRTKKRLNERKYVSFFSRLNQQESVRQGQFVSASLQNDFKYTLFKLNDLARFLLDIDKYFPDLKISTNHPSKTDNNDGLLKSVDDDTAVKLLIEELFNDNDNISTLAIISKCMNEYGEYYYKMSLKDWHIIILDYLEKRNERLEQVSLLHMSNEFDSEQG